MVVAPVRSDASKAKVQAALSGVAPGRLHTPVLDVHSLAGSGELGQLIADQFAASIDHVISISGGMEPAGERPPPLAPLEARDDWQDISLFARIL